MHWQIGGVMVRKRGVLWGAIMACVFMLIPSLIHEYLYWRDYTAPATSYVRVDYVHASDVRPGENQTIEMCVWVDEERSTRWTWELSLVDTKSGDTYRIFTERTRAILKKTDTCIQRWESVTQDAEYTSVIAALPAGQYQWEVVVEFTIDSGIEKRTTARSNVFTKL